MRKLLIILAFLPLFLSGQYQETNLDFLFNGSIAVNGSDTLLVDSITGTFDINYKLINIDFPIDSNYIPIKSNASLIMYNDTIPVACLGGIGLRNYNDADTLFIQESDKVLKSDNKELYPVRITRIGHYSIPTIDTDNYWQALSYSGSIINVPNDYLTIAAATAAATPNDTIVIETGIYNETGTFAITIADDGVNLLAIGDVKIIVDNTYVIYINASDNVKVSGIELTNPNSDVLFANVSDNIIIENCVFKSDSRNALNTSNNSALAITFNECIIKKRVDYRTTATFNDCLIEGEQTLYIVSTGTNTNYTCNYSTLTNTVTGIVYIQNDQDNHLNFCELNGEIYYNNSTPFNATKYLNGCSITRDLVSPVIQLDNGDTDGLISIINCDVYNENKTGEVFILIDYNVYIDSCDFYDIRSLVVDNTFIKETIIENTTFQSDSIISLNLFQTKAYVNKDSLVSSILSVINIKSTISGADSGTVSYNYLTTPICDTSGGIIIGNDVAENLFNTNYYDVIGNEIVGGGNCPEVGGLHSISSFNQKGTRILYNKVSENKHGCVIKSQDTTQNGTIIQGNLFIDCVNFFTLRGVDSVKAYNNTCVNYTVKPDGLLLFTHEDFTANPIIDNDIKNNIFANFYPYGRMIESDLDANITNTIIDYNIWYNEADTFALSNSVAYDYETYKSTFSKDANSFNTDPNFKSSTQLWPIMPSDAFANGLNLGSTYKTGLDISSVWPDNVVLKNQISDWTIGAYVVIRPAISTFNNGYWIYNGGYVILK